MIESATWTHVDGRIVNFNTDDIPFNSFTTEVDVRFSEKNRSQKHGIYPSHTYLGRRLFHAEGDIFADTSASYMQKRLNMVGALTPRPQLGYYNVGTLAVQFSGVDEEITSDCTIDGYPELPFEGLSPSRGRYQVNWKAFDPKMYGPYQSVNVEYNPNWQNIGGRWYDKTYDKIYSDDIQTQGDVLVVNSGNIETFPLLVFFGPATDPQAVMIRSDGQIFRFTLDGVVLASVNEWVVVDMEERTVTRNNGTNLYQFSLGSDWWSLEPPPITNIVTFQATYLATPAHMAIQWRNAYMV
jgi:hypothetical protein